MKAHDIAYLLLFGLAIWLAGTVYYELRGPVVLETTSARYWINFILSPVLSAVLCFAILRARHIPASAWAPAALLLALPGMFGEAVLQVSGKVRAGPSQWFSEWVAAFGLVVTILLTLRANRSAVPAAVGLYITSAYWFTASTSFANPAVTIARSLTDTFAGIAPAGVLAFIVAQIVGAIAGLRCASMLYRPIEPHSL